MKSVPLTVSVNPPVATIVDVGEIDVITGVGFKTEKSVEVALPPPFVTTIVFVPAVAVFDELSVIVNSFTELIVGVLLEPLNVTAVPVANPVPVIVSVGVVERSVEVGETFVIVGGA